MRAEDEEKEKTKREKMLAKKTKTKANESAKLKAKERPASHAARKEVPSKSKRIVNQLPAERITQPSAPGSLTANELPIRNVNTAIGSASRSGLSTEVNGSHMHLICHPNKLY